MSCTPWIEQLGALVDGELGESELRALQAHLADCADCRALLERQQWLASQLAELPAIEPDPQFEARFRARLARQEELREQGLLRRLAERLGLGWLLGSGLAVGTAAAVVVILAVWAPAPDPLDGAVAADSEQLALLESGDLELLEVLDVLEEWDGSEEI